MVLIEWHTPEKQNELLQILRKDGCGIPNNLVLETSIRYSFEQRYPVSRMRYFSTNDILVTPTYVFAFEENNTGFSDLFVRPPVRTHDSQLLEKSLTVLLELAKEKLHGDGQLRMLSDSTTRQLLLDRFTNIVDVSSDAASAAVFYMTDGQMAMARETTLPSREGFYADSIELEKDSEKVHANWSFSVSQEATAACFQHLPATVMRESSTGEAVSWEMSAPFGACSNLFTLHAFRNRGLGKLTEMQLVKNFLSQEFRPFKYVDFTHPDILECTRTNPLWTLWAETKAPNSVVTGNEGNSIKLDALGCFPIHYTMIKPKKLIIR